MTELYCTLNTSNVIQSEVSFGVKVKNIGTIISQPTLISEVKITQQQPNITTVVYILISNNLNNESTNRIKV